MEKIKVLYVIPRCSKGGPVNVLKHITEHIDPDRIELHLITIYPEDPNRSILPAFETRFSSSQCIPLGKKDVALGRTAPLRRAIEALQPDVVHSTGLVPDLAVSRICPEKQLVIAHSNAWVDYVQRYGRLVGTLSAKVHVSIYRRAACTVACSKSLSDIYRERNGLIIPYVRNGVPVLPERPIFDKAALRRELGLPPDKRIFVYAASFNKRKNQQFLAKAFGHALPDDLLLLLGDGPTFEEVKSACFAPNVLYAGRKSDVTPYLGASDFFISSSLQEGMPMAVLEAMAAGLPVVLSDIPQHKELFELDPGIGRMFSNDAPESLVQCVSALRELDDEHMSAQAFATVQTHFNAALMARQYQTFYESLAKRP